VSGSGVIVDDHLLLQVLRGNEPTSLRPTGAAISTTGLWYHRLCRALTDQSITGSMSKSLGKVDARIANAAVRAVIELPDTIGLVSLRSLGWPMASLIADGVRLNLLSLEALAAARCSMPKSVWPRPTTIQPCSTRRHFEGFRYGW
jgi:hypothetical protein